MSSILGIAAVLALSGAGESLCDDQSTVRHQNFAIETFVGRTYNYLDNLVDKDGPGPLYQRESMLDRAEPKPAQLHVDDGSLDFWWLPKPAMEQSVIRAASLGAT